MAKGKFIPYTEVEKEKIKSEYLIKSVKRLAEETGSSFGRIMRFLANNNLTIPTHIVQQRKDSFKKKKGSIPFNKGKKQIDYMTAEGIQRSNETRFKKGNEPHNTKKEGNGTIVTRKDKSGRNYKYIRIRKGHWELYHRVVWERENGMIPEGFIIIFKDNNTENINIENLQLITMTENMFRNSKHNYPQEIIPSLVLSKQIETKIKTLQNG